jgi:hypothetical protein
MLSVAFPLPIDPKMKFESRDVMVCPALGYTTLIARDPSTTGIVGSAGALTATGLGAGAGVGAVTGTGVRAQPSAKSPNNPTTRSVIRMAKS